MKTRSYICPLNGVPFIKRKAVAIVIAVACPLSQYYCSLTYYGNSAIVIDTDCYCWLSEACQQIIFNCLFICSCFVASLSFSRITFSVLAPTKRAFFFIHFFYVVFHLSAEGANFDITPALTICNCEFKLFTLVCGKG